MNVAQPNFLTVLIMALLYMGIGGLWYSKGLFGKMCCPTMNGKEKKGCGECGTKNYIACIITAFVMAYVLGYFINMAAVTTAMDGVKVALCAWVGFIATTMFSSVIWAGKPLKVYFVDAGFTLLMFIIWGAALAMWH